MEHAPIFYALIDPIHTYTHDTGNFDVEIQQMWIRDGKKTENFYKINRIKKKIVKYSII